MSQNSSGEKTEQPTPKKERDARQKGQVARSQETVTTISLAAAIAYLWATFESSMETLVGLMDKMALLAVGDFRTNALNAVSIAFRDASLLLLPLLGVVLVAGFFANYFQFGSIFAMENIMPKLEKVNPGKGFKRIFSMKQVVETLKSIFKIVFLSILLFFVIRAAIGPYINSVPCGMPCLNDVTSAILFYTLLLTAFAFLVVAVADFVYQRKSHTKSLMMSKEEVKREYKESEGDPIIKGKRKQLAQELIMSDGGKAASKSSAVVVNPTHLAVAIDYRPDEAPLPIVVAKGRNVQAHYLRSQAEEAGVPVFRNRQLARALFADVAEGQYIPDELFDAVAEVLAWVSRNKHLLYDGPLDHGVIDMEAGDHKAAGQEDAGTGGFRFDPDRPFATPFDRTD